MSGLYFAWYGFSAPERELERRFKAASAKGNCVLFLNEIDSLTYGWKSDVWESEGQQRLASTLVTLLDGISSDMRVFLIGAASRLDAVDSALRCPGRFGIEFEIPSPGFNRRCDLLMHLA